MRACLMRNRDLSELPLEEKLDNIGRNTGNLLFFNGIENVIEIDFVSYYDDDALKDYDLLVTTEFVWIRENDKLPRRLEEICYKHPNLIVVPVSIGLQATVESSSFNIHPSMRDFLLRMSERCKLGLRGFYTQDVLAKNGIVNTSVIGCPSIYQIPLYLDSFKSLLSKPADGRVVANYATFSGALSLEEQQDLLHIRKISNAFIEQSLVDFDTVLFDSEKTREWYKLNTIFFLI